MESKKCKTDENQKVEKYEGDCIVYINMVELIEGDSDGKLILK